MLLHEIILKFLLDSLRPLTSSCYRQCSRTELPLYIQPFNRTKGKGERKKGGRKKKANEGNLGKTYFFSILSPSPHQLSISVLPELSSACASFFISLFLQICHLIVTLLLRMLSASGKVTTDLFITHPYNVMSLLVFQTSWRRSLKSVTRFNVVTR